MRLVDAGWPACGFVLVATAFAGAGEAMPPWSPFVNTGTSVALDSTERFAGRPTVRIVNSPDPRPSSEPQSDRLVGFALWMRDATPYRGKHVRLRGQLKTHGTGNAHISVKVDGSALPQFRTGSTSASINGDHDWTPLEVSVDVPGDALAIVIGDQLYGPGTVWGTYPQLEVVGKVSSPVVAGAKPVGMLEGPARATVERALRRDAAALQPVDPTAPLADLDAFDHDVAAARVVGLGGASAGTAEFLRMKHRLFRDLVERHGFTVLAFDANLSEARDIDRYVTTGRGDLDRALRRLAWDWQTAEVRDLVRWMRAFNAAPGKHATLHFAGFDMQSFGRAISNVQQFADKRNRRVGEKVKERYACVPRSFGAFLRLMNPSDGRPACIRSVNDVLPLIAPLHPDVDLAHDARVVEQGVRVWLDRRGNGWGDLPGAQAENVAWLADRRYPGAKIAVLSQNGTIATQKDRPWSSLGTRLSERFGKRYVRIGFAFDGGSVSATNDRLGPVPVARAPSGTMEELLNDAGRRFYLPLRSLRADDPVAGWFDHGTLSREVSTWFFGADAGGLFKRRNERDRFDALIFISESHASAVFPSLLGPLHARGGRG